MSGRPPRMSWLEAAFVAVSIACLLMITMLWAMRAGR